MLRRARRDDAGAVLIIALAFMVFVMVVVMALLAYLVPNLKTSVVTRDNRVANYDLDSAMINAIATIRVNPASCAAGVPYTGTVHTVNVSCTVEGGAPAFQRKLRLSACRTSDSGCQRPLRASVTFYDFGRRGKAAHINTWSTR